MLDAHAHLRSRPADPDPDGVVGWIVPGVDLASEALAAELAQTDPRVRAAVGLHPWHLPRQVEALPALLEGLEEAIARRRPCAVGETGLDKGWRGAPRDVQRAAFEAQVAIAERLDLPLVIHCVRSHGACLEILGRSRSSRGGMVHDFSGPPEVIRDWTRAGFLLSISPRGMAHRAVIEAIPADSLLVESDDEGPGRLACVRDAVAAARGVDPGGIASLTEANARRLFGIPRPELPNAGGAAPASAAPPQRTCQ